MNTASRSTPRRLRGLLVVAVGLAILLELGTRAVATHRGVDYRVFRRELRNPQRLPTRLFVPDEPIGYRLVPRTEALATSADFTVPYSINEWGMRDRSYQLAKPERTTRILALGDSYTFGEGVPYGQRYADVPEQRIDGLEILNFGVPGYGIDQSLVSFVTSGLRFSPDAAVLFIHRIQTLRFNLDFDPGPGKTVDVATARPALAGAHWTTKYARRDDPFIDALDRGPWQRSQFLALVGFRMDLRRLSVREPAVSRRKGTAPGEGGRPGLREARLRTRRLLRQLDREANRHGVRLILVNIDPRGFLEYLDRIELSGPYYDLGDELAERKRSEPLAFPHDRHFNPHTNRFLGERLTQILIAEFPELGA